MLKYKRILMSIGIVLAFALVIQLLRLNTLTEWSKAHNVFKEFKNEDILSANIPSDRQSSGKYLVLHSGNDDISEHVFNNVVKAFEYMKKEYTVSGNIKTAELTGAETVVITVRNLDSLGDIAPLVSFMKEGGIVIFAVSPEKTSNFQFIEQKLGIYESGVPYHAEGIHMIPGILMGGAVNMQGGWISNSSLSVRLDNKCNVYARADDKNPLIWSTDVGNGKAFIINGTFLYEKSGMGIFSAILAKAAGTFLYPVINARVVYLDCFPLPFSVNEKHMKRLYGRNCEGFIRDIWWPDMASASRKFNLKYTSGFLASFESNTEQPIYSRVSHSVGFSFFGREILRYGGELSLTGFDDRPLLLGATISNGEDRYWTDPGKAKEGLSLASAEMRQRFHNYDIRCYNAPDGIISQAGFEAVRSAINSINVVRTVYEDISKELPGTDFKTDSKGIAYFPYISCGFYTENMQIWRFLNAATALGTISHTLDVRSIALSTDDMWDWKIIGPRFFDLCKTTFDKFPWVNSFTASQAAEEMKRFNAVKPHIYLDADNTIEVYCENFAGPVSFILRTGQKVKTSKACTVKKLESGFYLVSADNAAFSIELEGKK